jgi:uncharacterized protein (DUF433 family)
MAIGTVPASAAKRGNRLSAESLKGDLIRRGNPLFGLIWINPDRLGGSPCFAGTRVPLKNLFDYMETGHTIDEFVDDFDGVARGQATAVLELAAAGLLSELPKP